MDPVLTSVLLGGFALYALGAVVALVRPGWGRPVVALGLAAHLLALVDSARRRGATACMLGWASGRETAPD